MPAIAPEVIAGIANVIISLALAYVPGLNTAWTALSGDYKRAVTGALLVVSAAGALLWNCNAGVECVTANWQGYASALLAALTANVGTFVFIAEHKQAALKAALKSKA